MDKPGGLGGLRPSRSPAFTDVTYFAPRAVRTTTEGDRYLDSDAAFGVRSSLIADWKHHERGTAPDGARVDTPFSTLDFNFVLNRAAAAVPHRSNAA